MFSIDNGDIRDLESDLKQASFKAFPFATRSTINGMAFKTQEIARGNIKDNFTTRNAFTKQSIQVEQSRTLIMSRQAAITGSIAAYMEIQEFGGVKTKRGKEGVPLATSYSAGQGLNSQPRTRLPRKPNRLTNIALKRQRKGVNRKQRNLIAIKEAASSGRKFVFLDLGRRKGIFKVLGGKRTAKLRMVHDLSNDAVTIPKNPWLLPAVEKMKPLAFDIYRKALEFQLRRLRLFS